MEKYYFKKEERLCSQKIIDSLFLEGNVFTLFPFRIYWSLTDSELTFPARVAFSISKKKIKKAVDRNLIKRRIKEAYRKNKYNLYQDLESKNQHIVFILYYLADNLMNYSELEEKIKLILKKLKNKYESSS
jgi:ribonuclease P protein component